MNLDRQSAAARLRSIARRPAPFVLALAASIWFASDDSATAGRPGRNALPAPAAQDSPAPIDADKSAAAKSQGQPQQTPKVDADVISVEAVSARLKQLDAAKDTDVPQRGKLVELYQQALADLQQADDQKARGAEFDKARIAAPYQLESRGREAVAPPSAAAVLPESASLSEWEQLLAPAQQELDAAQKNLQTQSDEPQRRAVRRVEIPKAIAAARLKLEEMQQAKGLQSPAEESAALVEARQIARAAGRRALEAQIACWEKELQSYDGVSAEWLKLEHEAAERKVAELQQRVAAWREAINSRRHAEADHQASEAHWAAITAEPAVRQLADENSALAEGRQQLADTMQHLADDTQAIQLRLDKLRDEFKDVQDKISVAGLTDAVGQMLRKQRSELATIDADRLSIRRRQDEITRAQLQLFDLEEQSRNLRDIDQRARQIAATLPEESQAKTDDLRSLLKSRQKLLDDFAKDENSYFKGLIDLDSKQQELLLKSEVFRTYIDERVLWIRSTHPLGWNDFRNSGGAIAWLVKPNHWLAALRNVANEVRTSPVVVALAALLFALCVWVQRQLKAVLASELPATSGGANYPGEVGPGRAWLTGLAAVMNAVPGPALLWLAGWLCLPSRSPDADGFCVALGTALQRVAGVLLPLLLARNVCCRKGLAESHFGWPAETLSALRNQLRWLIALGLPLVAAVAMLDAQANDAWNDALGRSLFVDSQLVLAGFLFVALRPPMGSLHRLMTLHSGSWTQRLAYPSFLMLVLLPVVLSALAALGYYYTALRLTCRLQATVWLVMVVVILQASVSRWLTALYRRLAIQAALRGAHSSSREPPSDVDLDKVDAQTRRLLHSAIVMGLAVGLCLVWIDVLPALRLFDQITLWSDANSNVSLANLLVACLVAVMTWVAAANLPGLLEFALLQRLPLDNGVRYALSAVLRYTIAIVGLALGGGAIGIGWPKVQWLAAAVTFGLGFGLQEIFANFVSGLIVLIERPIRVGDTVTVGDVTGVVSRIRMRATTIVDGDRKELIVPNKEFITAKLVNWTLSDSVTRLVVRLGIAYGSDTQQVQQLLLRVAADTPAVLKNPPPRAVFMGFSEKWMDFELRVFVGNVDVLLSTRHQMNVAIDRVFRSAGVQLALPQVAAPGAMSVEPATPAPQNGSGANQKAA